MSEVYNGQEAYNPNGQDVYPPLLENSEVWRLGWSGPQGLYKYLKWILDNDDRTASAAEQFRFTGVGFHHLTVAQHLSPTDDVLEKIDLNFFCEEFQTTNESPDGGHAHARSMCLWAMYDPADHQSIEQFRLLPPNAPIIPGIAAEEYDLAILNKIVAPDGLGTLYDPVRLGSRRTTSSLIHLPAGAMQIFPSTDIHQVYWRGNGVGATVLRQGAVEHPMLNTIEGMIAYKGLTREDAEQVIFHRERLQRLGKKVSSSTVLLRPPGYDFSTMEERPLCVPPDRFPDLAYRALLSLSRLMRAQTII